MPQNFVSSLDMRPARLSAVLVLTVFPVMAQDATIQGQASDESRAVIPHVSITVTNIETGVSTTSQTNNAANAGVPRISTCMRFGTRSDREQTMEDKVRSVQEKLIAE